MARWSYLPILPFLFQKSFKSTFSIKRTEKSKPLKNYGRFWSINKECSVASYHSENLHIFCSIAGGGVIRIFKESELIFEDFGITVQTADQDLNSRAYDRNRKIFHDNQNLSFEGFLSKPSHFSPTFLQRTLLRIISFSSLGSRLARKFIDLMRMKKGTSLNQNSVPLADYNRDFPFKRSISVVNQFVEINDEILHDKSISDIHNVKTYFNTPFIMETKKEKGRAGKLIINRKINVQTKKALIEINK